MEDCIFCKIVSGEFDTKFLYEDETCVVFDDINPKDTTHLLVIPKKHIEKLSDVEESDKELLGDLMYVCKSVANQFGLEGYRVSINVGKHGGQEVFHLHIHLLSKFKKG